jgi:type IV pilus assembly protein PilA
MNYPQQPMPPAKKGMPTIVIILIVLGVMVLFGGGIMVTLAVYGTRKYIASAKQAEAKNSLGMMGNLAITAYERDKKLCPSASSPVPVIVPRAAKYQSAASDWEVDASRNAGFACLAFSMSMPQYYQYEYRATPTGFTAIARGDLDGDGVVSEFQLEGRLEGGQLKLAPTILETNPAE